MKSGVAIHTCNPSTQEGETGRFRVKCHCLSYFSSCVTEYHNQDNLLKKKCLIVHMVSGGWSVHDESLHVYAQAGGRES